MDAMNAIVATKHFRRDRSILFQCVKEVLTKSPASDPIDSRWISRKNFGMKLGRASTKTVAAAKRTNCLRRLATPEQIRDWSLNSLNEYSHFPHLPRQ
jgi:hypothetical protein